MVRKINDYLYMIKVSLPRNPLRDLNCYLVLSTDRNLLIDTGFNQPECLCDLQKGIEELGVDMGRTDIFSTHLHADHFGLASEIVRPGCQLYMGGIDAELLTEELMKNAIWEGYRDKYVLEGFPLGIIDTAIETHPARNYGNAGVPDIRHLKDGDVLSVGGVRLRCVHTPGHTPGHLCLYNEEDKLMILGDHVLFDITPNITSWPSLRNSLKSYMESLRKISGYEVDVPLPAHRECHISMAERIGQLLDHHERRLAEVGRIVAENPGASGYEVAKRMTWSIRAKSWEEFPITQKWFATGEALAHLYYLEEGGAIRSETHEGRKAYMCL